MESAKGSCCFVPVFSDLVFEDSRSPLISAVTSLRVLVQAYSLYLFAGTGLFSPGLTCPMAAGKPKPGSDAAAAIFFIAFSLFSALASNRAQSRRFILPALVSGVIYIGLLAGVDLPACDEVVKSGNVIGSAAAAVAIVSVDTVFSIITLGCLAMLLVEDPPAALGNTPRVPEERVSRIAAAIAALRVEQQQQMMPQTSSWVTRTLKGIQIAPLRHHLAAALTSAFVIAFASITGTFSTIVRTSEDLLSEMIGPFVTRAISDATTSIFVASLFACLSALAAIISSYAPMFDDLVAYATTAIKTETAADKAEVNVNELQISSSSNNSSVTASPLSIPLVEESPQRLQGTASDATGILDEAIQYLTRGLGAPFKDNALDLQGEFFSYYKASSYTALFVMNLLTLFALTTGIVSFIIFVMTSRVTVGIATELVVIFISSWIYQKAAAWFYARWVAKGTQILRPRLFVLLDFVFSCSAGIAQGFTSAIIRFVLGLLFMIIQMTNISRPLVPMQFAGLDSGFVAYGSMLKAALAPFPGDIKPELAAATSSSIDVVNSQESVTTMHQGSIDHGIKEVPGVKVVDQQSVPPPV